MKILRLRFDAPLMSFGDVLVDQVGPTDRFPRLSMLAGIVANALGFTHRDQAKTADLQNRLAYAARWDHPGIKVRDYQTVALGQEKMCDPGWTTRGRPEHRHGGDAARGTHIRYRDYWADGVLSLTLSLEGGGEPTVEEVVDSLREPARPLFLGRKSCLPAAPLYLDLVDAASHLEALISLPPHPRCGGDPPWRLTACWPADEIHDNVVEYIERELYETRDWVNQIFTQPRRRREGLVEVGR